jgi:hypothetical protein
MAVFNKFQCFVGDLGDKLHDLDADTLKICLSNTQPVNTNTILANITQIAEEHGYTTGGDDVTAVWSEAAGVGTLTGTDIVFTAVGGSFGPLRFAVLYNSTAANGPLIGWWDYGSSITILDGETLTVDFGASILTLT